MRLIVIIFVLLGLSTQSLSQTDTIQLNTDFTLVVSIIDFNSAIHTYDTCETDMGWPDICKIDGNAWYGCDGGLNLPQKEFGSMIAIVHGTKHNLDVSNMYNPSITGRLRKKQLNLSTQDTEYILSAWFSDGAGSYMASWKITENGSQRIKISTDEADLVGIFMR